MVRSAPKWRCAHLFLCLVVTFATAKIHRERAPLCRSSSGLQGMCVALKYCPKLRVIDEKPYLSRQEMNLLIGAAGACPPDLELYCCADGDIRWFGRTTWTPSKKPLPPVEVDEYNSILDTDCLQTRLGMDERLIGRASLDSSFGVFIAYTGGRKYSRCVGSLITPEYVLTAAHCVQNRSGMVLYVNAHHVTRGPGHGGLKADVKPRYVREVVIHEEYNTTTRDHDIALLRLNESVALGEAGSPRPICIPMGTIHDEIASVGHTLSCFGWGVNADGKPSDSKQWITLERISLELCQARMDSLRVALVQRVLVTERNICTITITGHDAFAGYSGGPLMYRKDGTWFLIGLINFGVGSTSSEFPVVSLNVQQYTDWILEHTHFNTADSSNLMDVLH